MIEEREARAVEDAHLAASAGNTDSRADQAVSSSRAHWRYQSMPDASTSQIQAPPRTEGDDDFVDHRLGSTDAERLGGHTGSLSGDRKGKRRASEGSHRREKLLAKAVLQHPPPRRSSLETSLLSEESRLGGESEPLSETNPSVPHLDPVVIPDREGFTHEISRSSPGHPSRPGSFRSFGIDEISPVVLLSRSISAPTYSASILSATPVSSGQSIAPTIWAGSWHEAPLYDRLDAAASTPHLIPHLRSAEETTTGVVRREMRRTSFDADCSTRGPSRETKRYHALRELVETEYQYLNGLRSLVQTYFATLPFLEIFAPDEIATITRNSALILELHERIGKSLDKIAADLEWETITAKDAIGADDQVRQAAKQVAEVFSNELDCLLAYQDFCSTHAQASDLVRGAEGKPQWEAFERLCASTVQSQLRPRTKLQVAQDAGSSYFMPMADHESPTSTSCPTSPSVPAPVTFRSPEPTPQLRYRFQDYVISPVQRICRYPLLFGQLLKNLDGCPEESEVRKAWEGLRSVAESVDEAKRSKECELRTKTVAARTHFPASVPQAFCESLGTVTLVSALHVLQRTPGNLDLKVRYYGLLLYQTHLVMVKVRKRDVFEAREWLPLRVFEAVEMPEFEVNVLPHCLRLTYGDYVFDLGASCESEKQLWLNRLGEAIEMSRQLWREQHPDTDIAEASPEDSLSSVPLRISAPMSSEGSDEQPRIVSKSRRSSISLPNSPLKVRPGSTSVPASPSTSSQTTPSFSSASTRGRLTATAASFIGRTPTAQRAAIDLRLADVLSDECLTARALGARQLAQQSQIRLRALSVQPKRASVQQVSRLMERRRQSLDSRQDVPSLVIGLDSPLSFESSLADLAEVSTERGWLGAARPAKQTTQRPKLAPLDTAVDSTKPVPGPQSSSGRRSHWRNRTLSLRRAASQAELVGLPARPKAVPLAEFANADVERNNSVSSNASSAETGHVSQISATPTDTPPSSIPPSPDTVSPYESESLDTATPGGEAANRGRWGGVSFIDGASNAFRLRRKGSQHSLHSTTAPDAEEAAPIQRRQSTLGSYFSKRNISSPALTQLFNAPRAGESARADGRPPFINVKSEELARSKTFADSPIVRTVSETGFRQLPIGTADESTQKRRTKNLRTMFQLTPMH